MGRKGWGREQKEITYYRQEWRVEQDLASESTPAQTAHRRGYTWLWEVEPWWLYRRVRDERERRRAKTRYLVVRVDEMEEEDVMREEVMRE